MSVKTEVEKALQDLAAEGGPVLEVLSKMNLAAVQQVDFDGRTALIARFGAMVAMDAPPTSYVVDLGLADEAWISEETLQAALAALAPLVGTARVMSAVTNLQEAVRMANR